MLKYLILLLTGFLFIKTGHTSNISNINNIKSSYVRINILSKQLRLLKEGKIKNLRIEFAKNIMIHDKVSGENIKTNFIEFQFNNQWHIFTNENLINETYELITKAESGNFFKIKIANDARIYPLPLLIKSNKPDPVIIINEELNQYAMDSAIAEYGYRNPNEIEAVKAQALLIKYRFNFIKKSISKDYDFSDLTFSQIYKGKLFNKKINPILNSWQIKTNSLKENIYFHSRCGGELYSTSVFNKNSDQKIIKDYLFRTKTYLCKTDDSPWERKMELSELKNILNFNVYLEIKEILYNKDTNIYFITAKEKITLPIETFRLKINRVKGWNFLKSNNFTINTDKKNTIFFSGNGLGHNNGFCQHGALELSKRGYNAYEILKHYFPGMVFEEAKTGLKKNEDTLSLSPCLSYLLFNINNGEIIKKSHPSVDKRIFPPGSLWKIIVTLYLIKERPDLFNEYSYNCKGFSQDKNMPERCWATEGHGKNNIFNAISKSCNLYFASLYNKIDYNKFRNFYKKISKKINSNPNCPVGSDKKKWAQILSGLDFSYSFNCENLIKLTMIIHPEISSSQFKTTGVNIPLKYRLKLFSALENTFILGTAKFPLKKYGNPVNYLKLDKLINKNNKHPLGIWGKTSTVIDGTNKPVGYGIFLGGYKDTGIIVFLREGNGHIAAHIAKWILMNFKNIKTK